MGFTGGSLLDLLGSGNTREPTRQMLKEVAAAAGRELTARAAAGTPRRTGRTAEAWTTMGVTPVPGGYASGTENPRPQARWLEYGTMPHELQPGRQHPGTEGRYMLAEALLSVEVQLPAVAAPALRDWAREIERGSDK